MENCEVLIVGGGPAGSACARKLVQAGLDVLLLDKQQFPRIKPCAGWITPDVLEALEIDREEYGQGRVLQEIKNFRIGLINGPERVFSYDRIISYGIRRFEFDYYLLQRSNVRRQLGIPVTSLVRHEGGWIVNGNIRTRLVVGAGGHNCPAARLLGAKVGQEEIVVAQAAEFALTPEQARLCRTPPDTPALYFCRDMKGYGWVFRKGPFLNVGLGRSDRRDLGSRMREFCGLLERRGELMPGFSGEFQGHAYLLYQREGGRACAGDGVLLLGDAAGLSCPQSGEGILPAIKSALLAADTIVAAKGDYRHDRLKGYEAGLARRFGSENTGITGSHLSSGALRYLGARLLSSSWFTRHIVLDRWFLHANRKQLYGTTFHTQ
jgi:menaquinone-9 beta-reductase